MPDTRRQICCGCPALDHADLPLRMLPLWAAVNDVPLRYVLECHARHRINAALVRLARWRYLS